MVNPALNQEPDTFQQLVHIFGIEGHGADLIVQIADFQTLSEGYQNTKSQMVVRHLMTFLAFGHQMKQPFQHIHIFYRIHKCPNMVSCRR
jgi:hypothetical protein